VALLGDDEVGLVVGALHVFHPAAMGVVELAAVGKFISLGSRAFR
jgi:hypothetical protein